MGQGVQALCGAALVARELRIMSYRLVHLAVDGPVVIWR